MDRNYRPLIITLVVMGVLALIAVLAFGITLRHILTPKDPGFPVTMVSKVAPEGEGVRVTSTLTAVEGTLPDEVTLISRLDSGRVRDPAGMIHLESRSRISDITVDGEPAQPGSTVRAGGSGLTVSYLIGRNDRGNMVAVVYSPVRGLDVRYLTVDATDARDCMHPFKHFVVDDPTHMLTTACDTPAVATPEALVPDSLVELPVWVRLHY